MTRKGGTIRIKGVEFLKKSMSGPKRVKKVGQNFIGRILITMEYAVFVEVMKKFMIRNIIKNKNIMQIKFDKNVEKKIKEIFKE